MREAQWIISLDLLKINILTAAERMHRISEAMRSILPWCVSLDNSVEKQFDKL